MNTIHRFLIPHSSFLIQGKCLLAFSHGLDSTALYHLLRESGIDFDVALVNYGIREQADEEEAAARELAERDGRRIFVAHAPRMTSDFEARARKFRYDFFESLIEKHGYDTLLTAHQLDDQLEWMLMRMIRGAGAAELAGMEPVSLRRTPSGHAYRIVRPLLEVPRAQLRRYLQERRIGWFDDVENVAGTNERSRIRPLAAKLMKGNETGIARSLEYLRRDRERLRSGGRLLYSRDKLRIVEIDSPDNLVRIADTQLKELGYLMSRFERERIERDPSTVLGRRWAVERRGNRLFIAPWVPGLVLPRRFREACRRAGIPPKIRPWLYRKGIDPQELL
ncbi:tRNA lysidine(34) synthetase TilS [Nitratifractor sp.]